MKELSELENSLLARAIGDRSKPKTHETIMGEATNSINPITGETYDFKHLPNYDTSVLKAEAERQINEKQTATSNINPLTKKPYLKPRIIYNIMIEGRPSPRLTENKAYYLALANNPNESLLVGKIFSNPDLAQLVTDAESFNRAATYVEVADQIELGKLMRESCDKKIKTTEFDLSKNIDFLAFEKKKCQMPSEIEMKAVYRTFYDINKPLKHDTGKLLKNKRILPNLDEKGHSAAA